jgi:hypothetical protein
MNGLERVRQARRSVRGLRAVVPVIQRALASSNAVAVQRLPPLGERLHSFEAAVSETYAWGRKAMAAAYRAGDGAAFADWRRAVKYHAYHVRLLAELWPDELGGRLEVLDRLAELLGEDHDLAVHARHAPVEGAARERLALVQQRQQALRALARPLGRRLFAERPASFVRRHRGHWKAMLAARMEKRPPLAEAWRRLAPVTLVRAAV